MKDGKKTTAIAVKEKKEVVITNTSIIENLISQAIKEKLPVETMEKFLLMRREVMAEQAKKAFDEAMSKFQGECPTIKKEKVVNDKNGKERYRYAALDSIISQIKSILSENGLSYSIRTENLENMLNVVCVAKHILGHSESSAFSVPIGKEEYMSDVQKYGARLTFAKRYAFCNAFGIMTGDDDTDGNVDDNKDKAPKAPSKPTPPSKPGIAKITEKQIDEIHNLAFLASKEISAIETLMKKPLKDFTFDQGNQWIDKLNKIIEEISEKVEPKKEPETIEGEVIDDVDMANGKELSKGGQIIKDELAKQGKGNIIK